MSNSDSVSRSNVSRGEASQSSRTSEGGSVIPDLDFETMIVSLCTSARIQLSEQDDRSSLALARQTIEMLSIIEVKTRGNLSTDESALLLDQLSQLKIKYAQRMG